jgi:hypothetical protein
MNAVRNKPTSDQLVNLRTPRPRTLFIDKALAKVDAIAVNPTIQLRFETCWLWGIRNNANG